MTTKITINNEAPGNRAIRVAKFRVHPESGERIKEVDVVVSAGQTSSEIWLSDRDELRMLEEPHADSQLTDGRVAFEAYFRERGGKNHDGSATPGWDSLTDGVRAGWEAAAAAVRGV